VRGIAASHSPPTFALAYCIWQRLSPGDWRSGNVALARRRGGGRGRGGGVPAHGPIDAFAWPNSSAGAALPCFARHSGEFASEVAVGHFSWM